MKNTYFFLAFFLVAINAISQVTLPYTESFTYSDGSLIGKGDWIQQGSNSVDNIVVATNLIKFDNNGTDTQVALNVINSGSTFYKFDMKVTDVSNVTAGIGGFFAGFVDSTTGSTFGGTLWVKRDPANTQKFALGIQNSSTSSSTTSALYPAVYSLDINVVYKVIVSYTFNASANDDVVKLWIDKTATDENSPNLTAPNDTTDMAQLGSFTFRQDSSTETPFFEIDNLKIATTFTEVLSKNSFESIKGLNVFPNPARSILNITSDSFSDKNIEIYNSIGAKVLATQVTKGIVNVSNLATGIYTIKISEDGKSENRKLVIE